MKPKGYADLAYLDEDKRIEIIGRTVMEKRQSVAFIVDDWPDKAQRYIRKLSKRFPGIRCEGPFPGPVPQSQTVNAFPPENEN